MRSPRDDPSKTLPNSSLNNAWRRTDIALQAQITVWPNQTPIAIQQATEPAVVLPSFYAGGHDLIASLGLRRTRARHQSAYCISAPSHMRCGSWCSGAAVLLTPLNAFHTVQYVSS